MNRITKLLLLDMVTSIVAMYFSFLLRYEFLIPAEYREVLVIWIPIFVFIQLNVFYFSGLYNRIWRYTSLFDLYAILAATFISAFITFIVIFFLMGPAIYPRSVLLIYLILNTTLTTATRLSVRVYFSHYNPDSNFGENIKLRTLLLVGAGKTGEKIVREILSNPKNDYSICGFVDDDPEKHGALIHGKKVFCGIRDLPNLKIQYDEILIATPSAYGDQMRRIVKACKQTGKKYKTLPSLNEIIDGEISLSAARDVSYSDLLGRDEVKLDMNSIEKLLLGKRVLITGAGGSIGSELVKQCLKHKPAEIICLDFNEEKVYNISQFSNKVNSKTIIRTVLASINDKTELKKVFIDNRPQIVFHAAAYKHVPIQENYPWTAVKTNVGGTLNIVELSEQYFVEKFVLVSTDKAVNPVNVMGATKRLAEKVIQSFHLQSKTYFMSVRFGNVLGSSGSAIPTFQEQINSGGPITVTHPEMTRYFMSIQEASQLILQCGALGKDGEIFLLEMGKPIKILQMAKDLIRLSGLEPEDDIPIVYTGLRPGEKLYEELQSNEEQKVTTNHKKIMILKNNKSVVPWDVFNHSIKELISVTDGLNADAIQIMLKKLLPTYQPRSFIKTKEIDPGFDPYRIKGQA